MRNPLTTVRLWAARKRYQPQRETLAFPKLIGLMSRGNPAANVKPSPANLRYFSRTPYARKAINTIKNPVASLGWGVRPVKAQAKNKQAQAQAEIVARCLDTPNHSDSFRSLIEQVIEDLLIAGAGVMEQAVGKDASRPLWLWPVDATTITPVARWDGQPNAVRFFQGAGYAGGSLLMDVDAKPLKAEDMVFMRLNPATDSPYGVGPLEVAYTSIARQLGVSQFAANLASNAQPRNMIYAGDATAEQILAFRTYWRNEVEGQGQTPILGNTIKPDVLRLHAGSDDALYLKWQVFLIRELATAFGLSPQNLGIEADVNRNTAETSEDRDWDGTIKPIARLVQAHINRDILSGRLAMPHLEFYFDGLDREDEQAAVQNFRELYQANATTPNEYRERNGLGPLSSAWGDMTWADVQIAIAAAKGAKQVDDPALPP